MRPSTNKNDVILLILYSVKTAKCYYFISAVVNWYNQQREHDVKAQTVNLAQCLADLVIWYGIICVYV